jgi:tetratricopeptide (TPR) repeat protein
MREPHDIIAATFDAAFSEPARSPGVAALEAARLNAGHGAAALALLAFREAVQARPRGWRLMGEAAEFLISIGSHDAARRLAEAALAINPWFSASLRNLLGDAQFHMQRFDDAAAQYRAANALNPRDARGHFNLAHIHFEAQDDAAARCRRKSLPSKRRFWNARPRPGNTRRVSTCTSSMPSTPPSIRRRARGNQPHARRKLFRGHGAELQTLACRCARACRRRRRCRRQAHNGKHRR